MNNNAPKITIVTPSYNQADFLERTIVSVLDQNYPNLEYILMDGGSNDRSLDIIKKYSSHFSSWVSEKDKGQSNALNRGFHKATGELFGWLNSDDTLLPGALEAVAHSFLEHGRKGVIYGDFVYIDENDKIIRKRRVRKSFRYETLLFHDFLGQPATFFSREAYQKAGDLDESLHYSMDWDYFLRLKREEEFHHCGRQLATYRIHPAAKSSQEGNQRYSDHMMRIRAKNGMPGRGSSLFTRLRYALLRLGSYVLRLFDVLRDNPLHFIAMQRKMSDTGVWKGILWRVRH